MYKISDLEKRYKIKERAEDVVKQHGSIENSLAYLKSELSDFENMWSKYSSEGLGHGISCNMLLIGWLERIGDN
jgi:hypothetical protein